LNRVAKQSKTRQVSTSNKAMNNSVTTI
jgi:hypothetical protein